MARIDGAASVVGLADGKLFAPGGKTAHLLELARVEVLELADVVVVDEGDRRRALGADRDRAAAAAAEGHHHE